MRFTPSHRISAFGEITTDKRTLDDWLAWMETLHPREIELGLERVRVVAERMGLVSPPFTVVTVGGTNGKGSTVAMLERILYAAGYRVGAYSSPHLNDYNERVRVGARDASDDELIAAFVAVDAARADTPLTYFEFGTLAAAELFRRHGVEIAVLEVGLGGRLDAVNLWDAEVAIVASIGTDHKDWLGPDREAIGREKAGIYRAGRCAICGDRDPPRSLLEYAGAIQARLLRLGRDFDVAPGDSGWTWRMGSRLHAGLPHPSMRGDFQLDNAACVLMALDCLAMRFPVSTGAIREGLTQAVLRGRFQTLPGRPLRVLDVAHNVEAAQVLARTLRAQTVAGRTLAVCAMLRDKPIVDVVAQLAPLVSAWHVAGLEGARAASAADMQAALAAVGVQQPVHAYPDVAAAYRAALAEAGEDDRVVVFGSFHTVGAILRALET